jgi:hypothetical protein
MNVPEIKMASDLARVKVEEYRAAVARDGHEEDKLLAKCFRFLERGKRLIDIVEVMRAAGTDWAARPKLAIARANSKLCWYECFGKPYFSWGAPEERWRRRNTRSKFYLREGELKWPRCDTIQAVIPSVPPLLRPRGQLDNFHILWEADWQDVPVDPLLLRQVSRTLFVVIGGWDLTPLERSVLRSVRS